ncbi:hypothetical protein [Fischerella sp. JS2]|nr:hypothetical protein [Fischerella sp. JS2]
MPVKAKHLYVYLDIKTEFTITNALPLPDDVDAPSSASRRV